MCIRPREQISNQSNSNNETLLFAQNKHQSMHVIIWFGVQWGMRMINQILVGNISHTIVWVIVCRIISEEYMYCHLLRSQAFNRLSASPSHFPYSSTNQNPTQKFIRFKCLGLYFFFHIRIVKINKNNTKKKRNLKQVASNRYFSSEKLIQASIGWYIFITQLGHIYYIQWVLYWEIDDWEQISIHYYLRRIK